MRIGIPTESRAGERLVAATPKTVAQLVGLGYEVVVQRGAGDAATFRAETYEAAGATVGDAADVWSSDVVAKVNPPTETEVASLSPAPRSSPCSRRRPHRPWSRACTRRA